MSKHTISHADQLFSGSAQYNAANGSNRGIELTPLLMVSLGAPIVSDPNGLLLSAVTTAGVLVLDGALAGSPFDVPRNVIAASDNAADTSAKILTVTGLDQYGEVMVEDIPLNGAATVNGLKAFAEVTSISLNTTTTGALTIGTGDVLGLPLRADAAGLIMAYADSAPDLSSDALGTFVVADSTDPATAITGDVRGTYDPNVTLDGSAVVRVLLNVNRSTKVSAYGVSQFGG